MNRREAIAALTALPLAAGMSSPQIVESDPMPLCGVIHCSERLSLAQTDMLRQSWAKAFTGKPPFPIVVIPHGISLAVVSRESILAQLEQP